ncbi:uncharacterized protein A1O9_07661 [Exophiala aquamarina CBS 119918]|uniref:Mitochondrial import inner membrane translocase subunit TIM54 n=1 Tax=Exophiala aquamarina CBS 119918 TaxID=1182545 RepID=A0A072PKM7_9EURO|nr:uncharacterized protein A1O9_07661 [Exophiala aquamarina CBS 119918]KEF56080.1 hypothetical protein A1O9_07661 [Exophiala aquamarina CBS 119918]
MADTPPKPDAIPEGGQYQPPKPPPKQNPVFRMMGKLFTGLPNFRFRLPSRNWMIFLTITGSWTAAVVYDRREKKRVQKKWCDLVSHISQEPLDVKQMRRKLTIFLSAPPGDGIRPSREYFKEYVKPVLVAAALDYDVIEGRKEGDVRYGTAEQIRRLRRRRGEKGPESAEEREPDTETLVENIRDAVNITPEPGTRGDLVLGRHTWKEYIRGLNEGWLGPVEEPRPPPEPLSEPSPIHPPPGVLIDEPTGDTESPHESEMKEEEKQEAKKKPSPPPAYLSIEQYSSAPLSPHIPSQLEPSQPIHQQHLLGFLKTPQRMYNFLNRRHLADQIGRETAAIVLAASRPYEQTTSFATTSAGLEADPVATRAPENDADTDAGIVQTGQTWEQQTVLANEERAWHKSVRKPRKECDITEQIWTKDVVLDTRVGERMRRFALQPEEEARANRIASGAEQSRAVPIQDLRAEKVVLGDISEEE